jgi:[ribosomal protein S5]-alanine N-acetyltransferase
VIGENRYETERLVLEPLRGDHAGELFELLSDERLYRDIPQDPPATLDALTARYRRLESRQSPGGDEAWLNWAVRSKSEGRCMGRIEVTVRADGSAILAYEIGPEFWRRGIAAEACRRVIRALFEEGGVGEVLAEVDTRNLASIRLLERLGFVRGGFRPNADFFKGRASDEWSYRLSRPPGDRALSEGRP